ncbi:MAG: FAD-dependent oxidoreductase [Pseudomonadota bacterium]
MTDVTIKGAGILGLSIAFRCLRRGAKVRVVDPNGPGAGASGGIVGALAPHVPENWNAKKAFQLESLLSAEGFWREVEDVGGGVSGYARTGRLQPIEDEPAMKLALEREVGARELWQGRAEWRLKPMEQFDFVLQSPTGFVIHDTLTARLHPRQACQALAQAITTMGGSIVTEAPTSGIIVEATGMWGLESLSELIGAPIGAGVKGQAAVLGYAAQDAPQLFTESLHIIPHADGTTAIGSTSERDYAVPDSTDHLLDQLIEKARKAVPDLADAPVLARWAGVRPRARTRAPMLGPCPRRAHHYIANGGFKIGFGMAPKIADVMCDLILGGRDTIPADFRVEASLPAVAR